MRCDLDWQMCVLGERRQQVRGDLEDVKGELGALILEGRVRGVRVDVLRALGQEVWPLMEGKCGKIL